MKDQSKTKQELLEENAFLKQKIQELEQSISERKSVEEALWESGRRFRELAEFLPETVYETDIQGTLTFVNRNAFDRFGYTPQDFARGLNALDMFVPEDHGRAFDNFQRVINGEDIDSIEYTFRRNDGSTFPGIMHSTVIIHDGKSCGLRGIMIDNTRQKQIETALKESELKYRRLFESSPVATYQIDFRTGKFLDANELFCGHFGCSREEITSHSPYEVLTDESKQLLFERLNKMSLGEKVTEFPEYEVIDKKGMRLWLQLSSKNIYDSEGLMGADVVAHDITARKQAENELRASQQQLRSLAGRIEQIREEERVIISREIHDVMGGGLTGLQMDLAWLMHKVEKADSDNGQAAMMDRILTSSESVDQMIKVTRRICTELRPPVLDDFGLIAALEWQLSEFTSRTGILHEVIKTFEHVNLEKDKVVGVFRIFQEALTNIARHSRATKVVVVIRNDERSLSRYEYLVLEIRDNGLGITEDEILNKKSLGLLGMKERAMILGGELSILGEPGGGTIVILKIPKIVEKRHDQKQCSVVQY